MHLLLIGLTGRCRTDIFPAETSSSGGCLRGKSADNAVESECMNRPLGQKNGRCSEVAVSGGSIDCISTFNSCKAIPSIDSVYGPVGLKLQVSLLTRFLSIPHPWSMTEQTYGNLASICYIDMSVHGWKLWNRYVTNVVLPAQSPLFWM